MQTSNKLFRPLTKAVLIVALSACGWAQAQEAYPSKPIRLISCCIGVIDAIARVVGEEMANNLKQPVVVEAKAGASGGIAADYVAKSKPDGYTIFFGTNSTHAANQSLFKTLPYDYVKDFVPLAGVGEGPIVLVVNMQSPVRNVSELTALAKSKPGKLTYGWASSSTRMSMEMYNQLAGIKITDVPYKTNPQATTDLIGGQVDAMFADMNTAVPLIKAGKLRALAVSGSKRAPGLPEVPTMKEAGVTDYNLTWWVAGWAPAGTPKEVVTQLNTAISKSITSPKVLEFFKNIALDPMPMSGDELMKFQVAEHGKWAKIINTAGIQPQ